MSWACVSGSGTLYSLNRIKMAIDLPGVTIWGIARERRCQEWDRSERCFRAPMPPGLLEEQTHQGPRDSPSHPAHPPLLPSLCSEKNGSHSPPDPGLPATDCPEGCHFPLCLTPRATKSSTPSPGFKPRPSFPSLPPLPSTYSPAQPREEGIGWEPRLCSLTRYHPSVLPGLALAKTRAHHRDGTGCWGREMSKAGLKRGR